MNAEDTGPAICCVWMRDSFALIGIDVGKFVVVTEVCGGSKDNDATRRPVAGICVEKPI